MNYSKQKHVKKSYLTQIGGAKLDIVGPISHIAHKIEIGMGEQIGEFKNKLSELEGIPPQFLNISGTSQGTFIDNFEDDVLISDVSGNMSVTNLKVHINILESQKNKNNNRIIVQLLGIPGKSYYVLIDESKKLNDLKDQINRIVQFNHRNPLKLLWRSDEIDDCILSDYGLYNNTKLHIIIDPRGIIPPVKIPMSIIASNNRFLTIYLMRHGDRSDDNTPGKNDKSIEVDRDNDCSLQHQGFRHAHNVTREHIMTQLPKGENIDRIYTSPMLRCIQTAYAASEELGIDTIEVRRQLCEVWHPRVLKKPINQFHERITVDDLLIGQWPYDHYVDKLVRINDKYPANQEQEGTPHDKEATNITIAHVRFKKFFRDICKEAIHNHYKNILLVSHGDSLTPLLELANKPEIGSIDYCALMSVVYDSSTKEFELSCMEPYNYTLQTTNN